MIKKILKWTGVTLLVLVVLLIASPFLFKDKIKALVLKSINEKVDATVAFTDVDVSLLKNFTNATVSIDELSVVNKIPFEGDTLFFSGNVNLKMSLRELFKGENEPMTVQSFSARDLRINIITNEQGQSNYDIAMNEEDEADSGSFSFELDKYEIENMKLSYTDLESKMSLTLDQIYHEGKGNLAADILDLDTKTSTKVTFIMDGVNYLNKVNMSLDAVLALDMVNSKYTFKENKMIINQLPLEFDGFIQLVEEGQLYDLKFKTPTSSFTNFLGLVPETYAGNIEQVKTTGDFTVDGRVEGMLAETTIPKFNIQLSSKNASFQYPDLPKSVKNIAIQAHVINETGFTNDTYVNIYNLRFQIDQDAFRAQANIKNLTENPIISADLKGVINLANLSEAYPLKLEKQFAGILKADVKTWFDMNSIEKEQYKNIKNEGVISLSGFNYSRPEMAKPFQINEAEVSFNTSTIKLNKFSALTGTSDMNISGTVDNFYGFLFNNQDLKGNFVLNSNQLVVADFLSSDSSATSTNSSSAASVKIPAFLDCSLSAKAKKVTYDNLQLSDVSGTMVLKDQSVSLRNLQMGLFGGSIGMDGLVSTKGDVPKFEMSIGLNGVSIAESFTQLDMLKSIAPIAKSIEGKLNSTIKLSGNLTNEMTPDLASISGDLFGQLLGSKITADKSPLLAALGSNVKFFDVNKLDLNKAKMALSFKDGKVEVKPFNLNVDDIGIEIGGSHSFDQSMNYSLKFDVPAKYLGQDVNNLLAKLSPSDMSKVKNIPITANVSGSFQKPSVSTDLKQASTNLANQLVQMEKEKLLNKGKDMLGGLLGNTAAPTDTTKVKEETKVDPVKSVIKGILKKKNNN